MEKYQVLEKAGSGNFSEVYKARNLLTDEIVAIKQMRNTDEIEDLVVRQLKIAATVEHPNIIKLKEIVRNQREIRVVFEYMEENLLELYTSSKFGINEHQLRCILFQSALGLEYLHRHRIIHRDIKPENILINRKTALIKLIDFGLAKEEYNAETDYVATRWYRSPENLIGMKKSTVAIDIFALGCVAVELFTLTPLFPGSDTIDQLSKIFNILGTPTFEDWSKGYNQLRRKNMSFGYMQKMGVGCIMPSASAELVDLLDKMLQLNPEKRITAREMILHPFFRHIDKVIPEHVWKEAQRLRNQIEERSRNKSSLLTHKNMQASPNRMSNPYESFYFSRDKKTLESSTSAQLTNKSRERPLLISTNFEDPERRGSNSRVHKDAECRLKVPAQKRYNYLSHENLSPTQSTQSKLSYYDRASKPDKLYNTIVLPHERTNILTRESNKPNINFKLSQQPHGNYSRVVRNHSLIQQSALVLNRSIERANIELSKSQPKVQLGSLIANKTVSYKRPLHY